ncbi:MAG: hypothetical protein JNJ76_09650, partial [Candidatus Competibacter sp.]|nr:hypothetical protein [Candidatus Competibacter sp.]
GLTIRQLCEQAGGGQVERRAFERLLEGLAGAGLVEVREDAFSRDGKVIAFWRVYLTEAGRTGGIGAVGAVRLVDQKPAPRRKRVTRKGNESR